MHDKNNSRTEQTVDAWIADQKIAARIQNADLDVIQRRFDGQLAIVRTRHQGIAIYSESGKPMSENFEHFMEAHTPFSRQKLDLRRI